MSRFKPDDNYIAVLVKAFGIIDKDKSGELEAKELLEVLKLSGFSYRDSLEMAAKIDKSNDGKVQLNEFISFFEKNSKYKVQIKQSF